jgi:hypothetical protein
MLNRSIPSFFHGKATGERPFCADCDAPIILLLLEQEKPGFELRTFACPMCAATESIVVRPLIGINVTGPDILPLDEAALTCRARNRA